MPRPVCNHNSENFTSMTFSVPSWSEPCSGGPRVALCGSRFFQPLCQLECVHVGWSVWSVLPSCWKPKLFQSHRQSHSRWMGSRVEERREGRGRLQRAQCLSSSRSSTLKKGLINRSLIGWRGHTHPFTDAGQVGRTPADWQTRKWGEKLQRIWENNTYKTGQITKRIYFAFKYEAED